MADEPQDRKPQPPTREPAQNVLNRFLKENNILIGAESPNPDIVMSPKGQLIITLGAPKIIALYGDERSPANPNGRPSQAIN